MLKNRNELKALKKDITEQIKNGIEVSNNLHIPNFITYGDNIWQGNSESIIFDGKLTNKEIEKHTNEKGNKVYKYDYENGLIITIYDDNTIEFSVMVQLIDEYDNISDWEYIPLNI